jgi:predicted negative regulator of RcsB-dependent stress response
VAAAPAAQSPSRSATSQWFAPHTSAPAPAVADAQPKSAAQAALARAQGQIESGKAKAAEKTLASVLRRKKLPRSDRATALRLMGMAEARRGHRKAAIAWYKKSLKATEDPTDRDRIAQHIRQLTKARKTADVIAAADTP